MVARTIEPYLKALAKRHPVVTLTGPRQSGKTTLCRSVFPNRPYVSLEPPDQREFARTDPRGFLGRYPRGAVIDEIQRVPDLLSFIQEIVDDRPRPGLYVLTGSEDLGLLAAVTQSLAGRSALLQLLPLGLEEIRRFPNAPRQLFEILWTGGYPRIYDRALPPGEWLASYTATYVERDVRQTLRVGDLQTFQTFLRLCAARVGQLVNLSGLGADCGITHTTARSWLSVLESSFIAFRLPPLHANLNKRLIKTPKLYFHDTGLLCYLLGIRTPEQLELHPLRGPIVECWVVSEILKYHVHRGQMPHLFFYRDRKGAEVDLIVDRGSDVLAVEIKSSRTAASEYFSDLTRVTGGMASPRGRSRRFRHVVVYGGDASQTRTAGDLVSWSDVSTFPWMTAKPQRSRTRARRTTTT